MGVSESLHSPGGGQAVTEIISGVADLRSRRVSAIASPPEAVAMPSQSKAAAGA
jgi:hypothetical protein